MKKVSLCMMALVCSIASFSKDLFVEPLGLAPAYSTISAAITAAEDGDNIYIDNGVSNIPFNEDLTIDKSIKLFSTVEGRFFTVQGTVTFDFTSGDFNSTIHGVNLRGSIKSVGNAVTKSQIVLSDNRVSLNVEIMASNVVTSILGCLDIDEIKIKHGSVIGNSFQKLSLFSDVSGVFNDTVRIIGNKAVGNPGGSSSAVFELYSSSVNYIISNNLIINTNTLSSYGIRVRIGAGYLNGFKNLISNNSIQSRYGTYIQSDSPFLVENNLIACNITGFNCSIGIKASDVDSTDVIYNQVELNHSTPASVQVGNLNTNNIFISSFSISWLDTTSPSVAVNKANPSPIYYDLDLTRGDAGAFGGSLSIAQFFPIGGKSKVFFVDAPRVIREGDPIFIQAEAYDR